MSLSKPITDRHERRRPPPARPVAFHLCVHIALRRLADARRPRHQDPRRTESHVRPVRMATRSRDPVRLAAATALRHLGRPLRRPAPDDAGPCSSPPSHLLVSRVTCYEELLARRPLRPGRQLVHGRHRLELGLVPRSPEGDRARRLRRRECRGFRDEVPCAGSPGDHARRRFPWWSGPRRLALRSSHLRGPARRDRGGRLVPRPSPDRRPGYGRPLGRCSLRSSMRSVALSVSTMSSSSALTWHWRPIFPSTTWTFMACRSRLRATLRSLYLPGQPPPPAGRLALRPVRPARRDLHGVHRHDRRARGALDPRVIPRTRSLVVYRAHRRCWLRHGDRQGVGVQVRPRLLPA